MCIIYFATHPFCTHKHLLGAFSCGLHCPLHQHHTFLLSDDGFLCETCMSLSGAVQIMDPDVAPVHYQPPLFDNDERAEWDEEVRERNRHKRRADMRTIPDAWVKEKEGWDEWGLDEGEAAEETLSPGRAKHKKLVEKQLSELVIPQEFEKEMMKAEDKVGRNT